jgi:imidazolonepropionase-like amidohydrolase
MPGLPSPPPDGLVDAHVHLTMDFAGDAPAPGHGRVAENLRRMRAAGVVAVRDAGHPPSAPAPRGEGVVAAGAFLAPADGFHAEIHDPVAPSDLLGAVRAQLAEGTPWIKVIADFPGPDGNWFAPRTNYAPELIASVVEVAHEAGARVMTHVSGPMVGELVRAGVDSIEHGPMATPDVVREMAERGTLWTPTVATIASYVGPLPQWRESIPLAVSLGVPVLAGSDELPAGRLWDEVVALHELAGLSAEDAVAAATSVPMRALDVTLAG